MISKIFQDSFRGGDYSGGTSLDFWCFVTVEISLSIDHEMWLGLAVGRRTDVILLTSTRTCPRLAFPNQPFASLFCVSRFANG